MSLLNVINHLFSNKSAPDNSVSKTVCSKVTKKLRNKSNQVSWKLAKTPKHHTLTSKFTRQFIDIYCRPHDWPVGPSAAFKISVTWQNYICHTVYIYIFFFRNLHWLHTTTLKPHYQPAFRGTKYLLTATCKLQRLSSVKSRLLHKKHNVADWRNSGWKDCYTFSVRRQRAACQV